MIAHPCLLSLACFDFCLFSSRVRRDDKQLIEQYKLMLNGRAVLTVEERERNAALVRIKITHHCFPGNGCNCKGYEDSKEKTKVIVLATHYRRRPGKPEVQDWTKLRALETKFSNAANLERAAFVSNC